MFSTTIHLLTLAAFSVHALFGCCGHHYHEHGTCVHTEICHESGHHDDSSEHEVGETHDEHDVSLYEDFAAAWFGCDHPTGSPIGHSHSCDEGSCAFVVPRSAPLLDLASIMAVVPIDALRIVSDSATPEFLRTASETECAYTLVGDRCALQQSWQI